MDLVYLCRGKNNKTNENQELFIHSKTVLTREVVSNCYNLNLESVTLKQMNVIPRETLNNYKTELDALLALTRGNTIISMYNNNGEFCNRVATEFKQNTNIYLNRINELNNYINDSVCIDQ